MSIFSYYKYDKCDTKWYKLRLHHLIRMIYRLHHGRLSPKTMNVSNNGRKTIHCRTYRFYLFFFRIKDKNYKKYCRIHIDFYRFSRDWFFGFSVVQCYTTTPRDLVLLLPLIAHLYLNAVISLCIFFQNALDRSTSVHLGVFCLYL